MSPHDFSRRTLDGRYTLLRRVGYGGMATVYEAVDHQLDKQVAIKVLNPEFTHDVDHIARFRQEARSAAKVRHPHLVDVTDQGYTKDGLAYFVMEYLDGESVGRHIQRNPGPCPWPLVIEIAVQVCAALEAAHERGIIHRDIKPGNCFLERRRGASQSVFVKVLDLGIAKVRGDERDADAPPSTRHSQGVPGTPEYMAPELVRGLPYDRRIDLYALGIMMYRLLTGELPFFSAASSFVTLEMQCNKLPRPPRELNPAIPEDLERLVLRTLSKGPDERPQTAAELAALLQAIGSDERTDERASGSHTLPSVVAAPATTPARRLFVVSAALGGLLSAAALVMLRVPHVSSGDGADPGLSPAAPAVPAVMPAPASARTAPPAGPVIDASAPQVAAPPSPRPQATQRGPRSSRPTGDRASPTRRESQDRKMIERALARQRSVIEQACRGKINSLEDEVKVGFTLSLNLLGAPTRVTVNPPYGGTHLGRCVEAELKKIPFQALVSDKPSHSLSISLKRN